MRVVRWFLHRPTSPAQRERVDALVELESLRMVLRWVHEDVSHGKLPRAAGWLREAERSIGVLEREIGGAASAPAEEVSA